MSKCEELLLRKWDRLCWLSGIEKLNKRFNNRSFQMQVDDYLGVSSIEMDMWGPFLYTSNLIVSKNDLLLSTLFNMICRIAQSFNEVSDIENRFSRFNSREKPQKWNTHPIRGIDVFPVFLYTFLSPLTLECFGLGSSLRQLILLKAECYNISFNIDELFSLLKGHSWKEFV